MQGSARFAAPLAAFLLALALAGAGMVFPVFSQLQHPVGLPGASGVPHAAAFNVLAFALPGALAAWASLALRERVAAAGAAGRIGAQALMLSGLAFAAQGLLPLDSGDLDALPSRLHAAAWTVWWVAFAVGATLLAAGIGRGRAPRTGLLLACAGATLVFALAAPALLPAGLCQRLAIACWLLALWIAGRLSDSAA